MMPKAVIALIFSICLNAGANILIKVGMTQVGETSGLGELIKKAIATPAMWLGVLSFSAALVAYSMVLAKLNLSVAYPINVSMGIIIVVLVSGLVLKEVITPWQIAGFVLIIAGVWMVAK